MGHHADEPFDGDPEAFRAFREMRQATDSHESILRKLKDTSTFRGALGDFPMGHLTKQDEGAIQFAVGSQDGKVVLDFGTSVRWIGMSPQQAADLAADLFKWARLVGLKKGEAISLEIG